MSNVLLRAVEAYKRGEIADAARLFEKTLAVPQHNLGVIAARADDEDEAIRRYRAALANDPARAESAFELSLHLLRLGRYAEAWPFHEGRRTIKRLALSAPAESWPEWTGQDLAPIAMGALLDQETGF